MEDVEKGHAVVCKYNELHSKYCLTIGKTYIVRDVKVYGAFPTYVIENDRGTTNEYSSILFLSLKRDREVKLEKLGI